jgi:hypothetical protein
MVRRVRIGGRVPERFGEEFRHAHRGGSLANEAGQQNGERMGTDKRRHPYSAYESTDAWRIIDAAITELVENRDLEETTAREYIVGYLVKALTEGEAIKAPSSRG